GKPAFNGQPRWLEIAVSTNAAGSFSTLTPRQSLTPAPYAIYAASVSAAGISGQIPDTQLSPNVARLNAAQTFTGAVQFKNPANTFTGTFSGNGSALSNVPGAIPTQIVTDPTVQAQSNTAYDANGDTPLTVTLPPNAAVGDVVRVAGLGAAGWQVRPPDEQVVNGYEPGAFWIP